MKHKYKGSKIERARAASKAWYDKNKKPGKVFYTPKQKKEAQARNQLKWRLNHPEGYAKVKKSAAIFQEKFRKTDKGKAYNSKNQKEWRLNNPEKSKASQRIWRKNNPDKCKAIKQRYLERKRNGLV
jgi:hypothetical protein